MVTSSPLVKTRCAASGSAQMLNSAAGVTLPSAIAPPISTIRSGLASGWRASRSATFVSGPVATSVAPSIRSARKSTACCGEGSACGGGRSGPSRPVSPCTSAATRGSRTSGRPAPAATGMSPRPASSSTRIAFAVVFSSVWLPATVVTPRSSSSSLPSASSIAIASSWPGSQSSRIGVLMRLSISSTSAAVGSDGWAPAREAAIAPAAQARRNASSRSRSSSSETTRHAVNESPAAVPSTAWTRGASARATSSPSSIRTAPAAPSVSASRRGVSGSESSS